MSNPDEQAKVKWHEIFAAVQQELLSSVNIIVQPEFSVTTRPPQGDILLLQPGDVSGWTQEQQDYLPDGIRDSLGQHHLLELKYTESVNRQVFEQVMSYDHLYRQHHQLSRDQVRSFILSSQSTLQSTRERFGYTRMSYPGVYHSEMTFLEDITLILLNDLRNEPHNVFFKLFGSQHRAKLAAVRSFKSWWLSRVSKRLYWLIVGLLKRWFKKGEVTMEVLTVEQLIEEGKRSVSESLVSSLSEAELIKLIEQTPVAQQLRAEGRAEGEAKGRAEGEAKGRAEGEAKGRAEGEAKSQWALVKNVALILTIRFQADRDDWQDRLAPLTIDQLDQLTETALLVTSLAKFEAAFDRLLPSSTTN